MGHRELGTGYLSVRSGQGKCYQCDGRVRVDRDGDGWDKGVSCKTPRGPDMERDIGYGVWLIQEKGGCLGQRRFKGERRRQGVAYCRYGGRW